MNTWFGLSYHYDQLTEKKQMLTQKVATVIF